MLRFVSARFQGGWGYQALKLFKEAGSWDKEECLQSSPILNAEGSAQQKGNMSVTRSLSPHRHLRCSLSPAGSSGGLTLWDVCLPPVPQVARTGLSLVPFTKQGICPDPGGMFESSPGWQNLGAVLWPRLNHHSWVCSCVLILCACCHILGYISYSELKLLSANDLFLLIWNGWTLNSCCLTSWNINTRLERCPWLVAPNTGKNMYQAILLFQDHLWQYCPAIMNLLWLGFLSLG